MSRNFANQQDRTAANHGNNSSAGSTQQTQFADPNIYNIQENFSFPTLSDSDIYAPSSSASSFALPPTEFSIDGSSSSLSFLPNPNDTTRPRIPVAPSAPVIANHGNSPDSFQITPGIMLSNETLSSFSTGKKRKGHPRSWVYRLGYAIKIKDKIHCNVRNEQGQRCISSFSASANTAMLTHMSTSHNLDAKQGITQKPTKVVYNCLICFI